MEFDVVHRADIKHQAADALYRLKTTGGDTSPLDDDLPVMNIVGPPDEYDEDDTHYAIDEYGPTRYRGADELEVIDTMEQRVAEPVSVPTPMEFVAAQKEERLCPQSLQTVRKPGCMFDVYRHGWLVRNSEMDEALKKLVPQALRHQIISLKHGTITAEHPGSRRMYETMRHEFYWPHMDQDVRLFVKQCRS